MRAKPSHSCFFSLLPWFFFPLACGLISIKPLEESQVTADFQDVTIGSPITVRPFRLVEYMENPPGVKEGDVVACTRVRIPGQSRLKNTAKFAHTARVKIEASCIPSFQCNLGPRLEICFHKNESLGVAQCPKDSWRVLEKGLWTGVMSPFETRFVDIRALGSNTDIMLNVSIHEEQRAYRLVFMAVGMTLILLAPIVSGWVPFYYSSAMTLGIILVVLILLFQGMKLLPTGRKSTMYIALYGSLVGLGTIVLHYFSGLLSTILLELGFGEDMFNPVAMSVSVCIGLLGACLGYWGVRKLVLSEDGGVDIGTAKFVKWAIRVIGGVMLLQTSHDVLFAFMALVMGSTFAWLVGKLHIENIEFAEFFHHLWSVYMVAPFHWLFQHVKKPFFRSITQRQSVESPRRGKRPYMDRVDLDVIHNIPGKDALVMWEQVTALSKRKGLVEKSSVSLSLLREEFYSTYHKTPNRKPLRKDEYKAYAITDKAVDELVRTNKFQEWWAATVVANNHISIAPMNVGRNVVKMK